MMKTPGEVRYVKRNLIENSLQDGIKQGVFGVGHTSNDGKDDPVCLFFKEEASSSALDGNNIIISSKLCELLKAGDVNEADDGGPRTVQGSSGGGYVVGSDRRRSGDETPPLVKFKDHVNLGFDIPRGKVSQIMGVMNLLHQRFERLHLQITASNGSINEDDYANKIKEALRQLGIRIEE